MVTNVPNGRPAGSRDECYRLLADARRRDLLEVVFERAPHGIGLGELAIHLAARADDVDPESVSDDHRQRSLLACRHRDLPPLLETGLLEERDKMLHLADHWVRGDPVFEAVLIRGSHDSSDSSEDLDAVITALADGRRRTALAVLSNRNRPISTRMLARIVATREADRNDRETAQDHLESVSVSLVHIHIPVLEEIGLVSWDAQAGPIAYVGAAAKDRRDHDGIENGTPIGIDDGTIRTTIEQPLHN